MKVLLPFLFILTFFLKINAQNCGCWIDRTGDTAFHVVPFTAASGSSGPPTYRSDDGSTNKIPLPFSFCFFGSSKDSLYINNNGNVSFSAAYPQFSPHTFPLTGKDMIAPFWADVDVDTLVPLSPPNLMQSGLVYWKHTATYVIVQWDSVGYYGTYGNHTDKVNTFQCIMTNGSDPIIPYGNVQFCYKSMQWTTGDASGGTNGFGGHPATVGANKGDGTTFTQIGLFDRVGSGYLGQFPAAPYDGISWLDNQGFLLNTCYTQNLPPIAVGIIPCEDTLVLCKGVGVNFPITFLAGSNASNVTIGYTGNLPSMDSIKFDTNKVWVYAPANTPSGTYNVTLYGYNNATPPDTTFASIVLKIDTNTSSGNIVASKDSICPGDSVTLKVVNSNATSYLWSNFSTADSIIVNPFATATYTCVLNNGSCINGIQVTQTIKMKTIPVPVTSVINGPSCNGGNNGNALATENDGFPPYSYQWSNNQTSDTLMAVTAGTYTVTAKDSLGCSASALVTITQPIPVLVTIDSSAEDTSCNGNIWAVVSGGTAPYTYMWTPGSSTADTLHSTCPGIYSVLVTDNNGCKDSASIDFTVTGINSIIFKNSIEIYPNPTYDIITIKTNRTINGNIYFTDVLGQQVYAGKLSSKGNITQVSIGNLSQGVYLLKLESEEQTVVKRVVKL